MKTAITTTYTFNPAAGTLYLSGISGFNIDLLYEVIDLTTNQTIYDSGVQALGYSSLSGATLTLKAKMDGLSAGDVLQVLYDVAVTGGGGGGGGAITAVDGAIVDIGTEADTPWTGTGSATEIAVQKGTYNLLRGTLTVSGAVSQGTAAAAAAPWYVAPGTGQTFPVSLTALPALVAGSAIIGKVGIDQTTPGTTNGVVEVNSAAILARTPALNTDGGSPVHVANTPGSTGTDYSINKPTLPNVGANFAGSGPFANYVLIGTIPASPTSANWFLNNFSGQQIVYVRDDGTATSGTAPANASVFLLAAGSGVPSQGGSDTDSAFKGRIQIYAAAALSGNAFVTAGRE